MNKKRFVFFVSFLYNYKINLKGIMDMKKIRFSWMEVQEAIMNCLEQLQKED